MGPMLRMTEMLVVTSKSAGNRESPAAHRDLGEGEWEEVSPMGRQRW